MATYSGSISLMEITDIMEQANTAKEQYQINTSCEELLVFRKDEGYAFSPTEIKVSITKIVNNDENENEALNIENFDIQLKSLLKEESSQLNSYEDYYYGSKDILEENIYNSIYLGNNNFLKKLDDWFKEMDGEIEGNILQIKYDLVSDNTIFKLTKILPIRYGISKDTADFFVKSEGITLAMSDSKVQFDANGLTVENGNFKIIKKGENGEVEELLRSDEGDLTIKGNVFATGGQIGGFVLLDGVLKSTEDRAENQDSALILDGKTGEIIAQNIKIGTNAVISDYIQLGKAKLCNPNSENNEIILEAGNFSLSDTGKMSLGNITFYGGTADNPSSYLKANNNNWQIYGDGRAIFSDIWADNVHLQDTILEINSVQAMGSLMIFKDSWDAVLITRDDYDAKHTLKTNTENENIQPVEEIEKKYFYLLIEQLTNLKSEDWIYTENEVYKIEEIFTLANLTYIKIIGEINDEKSKLIITRFGQVDSDCVFSILGHSLGGVNTDLNFATDNSLTISTFNETNSSLGYNKKLILGDLNGFETPGGFVTSGFGLYSDNVFLHGALTTQIKDSSSTSYAGINTSSNLDFLVDNTNQGNIVFWAGASSQDNIAESPFIVTDQGYVYASNANFVNSVIVGSTLEAATIKTETIIGTGSDPASLIFENNSKIAFRVSGSNENYLTFNSEGFSTNTGSFISLNTKNEKYYPSFIIPNENEQALKIEGNNNEVKLSYYDKNSEEMQYQSFVKDEEGSSVNFGNKDGLTFSIQTDESVKVHEGKKILYGDSIEFRWVEKGYELYIREIKEED